MLNTKELLEKMKEIRLLKNHLETLQKPSTSLIIKLFHTKEHKISNDNEIMELSYKIITLKLEILQALIKDKQYTFINVDYILLEKWIS